MTFGQISQSSDRMIWGVVGLVALVALLTGLLVGYMVGNALAVQEFESTVRWLKAPIKVNTTSYMVTHSYMLDAGGRVFNDTILTIPGRRAPPGNLDDGVGDT